VKRKPKPASVKGERKFGRSVALPLKGILGRPAPVPEAPVAPCDRYWRVAR